MVLQSFSFIALCHIYFLLFGSPASAQLCSSPDGTNVGGLDFQPCPQPALKAMCCGLNRTLDSGQEASKGNVKDVCMPNGLCSQTHTLQGLLQQSYWRGYCTEDWKSGKCLDVCTGDRVGGNPSGNLPLVPCDGTANSTRWCCGEKCSCADERNVVSLAAVFGQPITSTSSTQTTSSTVPSDSAVPKEKENLNKFPNTRLSTGAKAGICIAAAVGVLFLLGLGFFIVKALRWKKKAALAEQNSTMKRSEWIQDPTVYYELAPAGPSELVSNKEPVRELS